MDNDEVVIDLRVLLWEILRKWQIILIACIVFAAAFGALGAYKYSSSNVEVPIEDLYDELEPFEVAKVENLVAHQSIIDDKTEYMENSIYLSLDPNNVNVARIDFMLNHNINNKYIRQMYMSFMFDGDMYKKVAAEFSEHVDAKYLIELISYMANNGRTNVNEDSEINYEKGDDLNRLISVKIIAKNKKQSEELQALIVKNVEEYSIEVQKEYEGHSIKKILSSTYQTTDNGVLSAKAANNSQIMDLYNQQKNVYDTLDETQVALYDQLIRQVEGHEEDEREQKSGLRTVLKYIIIGILFGGFIVVAAVAVLTMFNGKIFVQRQITNVGLARVFGTFGQNKSKLARLILGDIGNDKPGSLDIIVAKINTYCNNNNITSLNIINNCVTKSGQSQMGLVIGAVEKSGIKCNQIALSEGGQKYTELCNKNNIVVIEELGRGTLKELEYMFTQLKDLGSEASGVICVQ